MSITIELSTLLKKNVSTYTWWCFDFDDCLYENWKEDIRYYIEEGQKPYIMKDDKKVYLDDEAISHIEYDYDVDFDNLKIWIAETIGSRIAEEINLEEIFAKYWIVYVWNGFYTPKYYNFDNDSYDIQLDLKPDEDTYWEDFLEKYWLVELVEDYIENVRIPSYDWYMSYEPRYIEDVVRDDYCTIRAILQKENVFEKLQEIFDDIVESCDVLYIREENITAKRYTLDEYTYEDWSTGYKRSTEGVDRKTYDVLFE